MNTKDKYKGIQICIPHSFITYYNPLSTHNRVKITQIMMVTLTLLNLVVYIPFLTMQSKTIAIEAHSLNRVTAYIYINNYNIIHKYITDSIIYK
jgi:hypothetical protein